MLSPPLRETLSVDLLSILCLFCQWLSLNKLLACTNDCGKSFKSVTLINLQFEDGDITIVTSLHMRQVKFGQME